MAMSRSKNEPFNLTDKAYRAVNEAAESYTSAAPTDEKSVYPDNNVSTKPEFDTVTETKSTAEYGYTEIHNSSAKDTAPKTKKKGSKTQKADSSNASSERKIRIPNTGIYFYEDQIARLRELSYLTKRSQSEIVRDALDFYLIEKAEK